MGYGIYLLLSFIGLLFALFASFLTNYLFKKHVATAAARNITPVDFAKEIIQGEGLDVKLELTPGNLADHYDPFANIARLSAGTSNISGISPLAVTAHEFGHALQDKNTGILFKIRNILAGIVGIATNIGYFLLVAGLILSYFELALIGLVLFSATTFFMFITLPIEIDASLKGLRLMRKYNVITDAQSGPARAVLTAAALTYVAGFLQSFIQLLYFANMVFGRSRD